MTDHHPKKSNSRQMFCNTEVLDAAGVAVPGADYTWDQFLDDCQKISDAGYTPIAAALGNIPHYWWEYAIFNNGSPENHLTIPKTVDDETFAMFTESKATDLIGGLSMVNQLMSLLGCSGDLIDWKNEKHALVTMLIPVIWQYVGFYFVIIVTGLNNISADLYEVASIDGAGRFQRIRYITLPLLHNVLCTCVPLAVTGALKVFDLPWIMFPKGMPQNRTWLTSTYMYYHSIETRNTDYCCALAVLIVVLGIISA